MPVFVGEAIYYRLKNDAGIAAVFGTRISPGDRETIPNQIQEDHSIIFSRVAGESSLAFDLTEQVNSELWQIDIYSTDYVTAQDQSLAVKNLFHGFVGVIDDQTFELIQFDSVNDSIDVETDIHRVSLNFRFFFNNV